jgi:hypothetical protein
VQFENGSRLERINEFALHGSGMRLIVIPFSVVFLGRESFGGCKSLESVIVESGSRLERIDEFAFEWTGLQSIVIPSSVVVLSELSFYKCKSLESVTFEDGSRLERIEESAFLGSGLKWIVIPSSVVVLGKLSFSECALLESVTFENGSRLELINESAFSKSGLKSIEIPPSVAFMCGSAFVTDAVCSVSVSRDNPFFRIHDSFLEDICGSTICRYFGSCRSIVIPSSAVVVWSKWSFSYCKSLESVTFENGSRLERIEESAFRGVDWNRLRFREMLPSFVVLPFVRWL